jgi:glycosyltransferase involved in cell wall biosynthesis
MVSTPALHGQLAARGFKHLVRWPRGVATQLWRPRSKGYRTLPRPIAADVGRVAIEKNVAAFLRMIWSGSTIVIGDGPEKVKVQAQYLQALYLGFRFGEDQATCLAASDIRVFQSCTDTFGLVNLEALASSAAPGVERIATLSSRVTQVA